MRFPAAARTLTMSAMGSLGNWSLLFIYCSFYFDKLIGYCYSFFTIKLTIIVIIPLNWPIIVIFAVIVIVLMRNNQNNPWFNDDSGFANHELFVENFRIFGATFKVVPTCGPLTMFVLVCSSSSFLLLLFWKVCHCYCQCNCRRNDNTVKDRFI